MTARTAIHGAVAGFDERRRAATCRELIVAARLRCAATTAAALATFVRTRLSDVERRRAFRCNSLHASVCLAATA